MPPITVRGSAIVLWQPAWTLTITSPDGLILDADGEVHPLRVSLVHTITSAPQVNRQIVLGTTLPGRVGDNDLAWTDSRGRCSFQVSSEDDETVAYEAHVATAANINDSLVIQWGSPPIPPTPPSVPTPPPWPGKNEWVLESATPIGGGDFQYLFRLYTFGIPQPADFFTVNGSAGLNVICCPGVAGPGDVSEVPPLADWAKMNGDLCPSEAWSPGWVASYLADNCVGL